MLNQERIQGRENPVQQNEQRRRGLHAADVNSPQQFRKHLCPCSQIFCIQHIAHDSFVQLVMDGKYTFLSQDKQGYKDNAEEQQPNYPELHGIHHRYCLVQSFPNAFYLHFSSSPLFDYTLAAFCFSAIMYRNFFILLLIY